MDDSFICNTLQHIATHCNTLQHTATHCTTLHHTAPQFNESSKHHQLNGAFMSHMNAVTHSYLIWMKYPWLRCMTYALSSWYLDDALIVLKCVAGVLQACCSMLHCVAACCSVLQCVALCYWYLDDSLIDWIFRRLWMKSHSFIAVVHTLQHTATHCNTLQRTVQHTTAHCNAHGDMQSCMRSLSCISVVYTLQYTATHCNTLQRTRWHATMHAFGHGFQSHHTTYYVPFKLPSIALHPFPQITWDSMKLHSTTPNYTTFTLHYTSSQSYSFHYYIESKFVFCFQTRRYNPSNHMTFKHIQFYCIALNLGALNHIPCTPHT